MRRDPFMPALAFRLGQIDTLARFVLTNPHLYTPEMRGSLGLRWLTRTWAQYREDRAIEGGRALFDADCTPQRLAFLTLLTATLPQRAKSLAGAVRAARKIDILPLADEARQAEDVVSESMPILVHVGELMRREKPSPDPVLRLASLVDQCRYTTDINSDAAGASAKTPCWAINLVCAARGFGLTASPLPLPGVVRRRLFRADRNVDQQHQDIGDILLEALHDLAVDIAVIPRANDVFSHEFADLRRNSRLALAWLTLFGVGGLTAAQMARALPATKAGAAKLLRQLEESHLVRGQGPFAPYLPAASIPLSMPAWRERKTG